MIIIQYVIIFLAFIFLVIGFLKHEDKTTSFTFLIIACALFMIAGFILLKYGIVQDSGSFLTGDIISSVPATNYSLANVNNSLFWQGHTGTDGSWLTGIGNIYSNGMDEFVNTTSSPQFAKVKTPIIYPTADSTTAVQINKADGTTNVLNVDTTNSRVGIGTTAPAYALDVVGAIKTSGIIYSPADTKLNNAYGTWLEQYYNGGGMRFFKPGGAEYMRLIDGGNLGIGTTTPNYKLDVNGSVSSKGYLIGTTVGINATITTAPLTALGSAGNMTFVGGILVAQTQAT